VANRTDAELEKFAVELVIKKCPFIKSKKKKNINTYRRKCYHYRKIHNLFLAKRDLIILLL